MLDANIASSLKKIIHNSNFKKRNNLAVQKAQLDDRFLRGKQIAFMIYEFFRVTGAHEAILGYPELFGIIFHGGDVQGFFTRWDEVLYCQSIRYPRAIFWNACKRCESVRLINSKPFWHETKKILNNIIHNRATRN